MVIGSSRPDSLPRHLPFLPFRPFFLLKKKKNEIRKLWLANFGSVGSGLSAVKKEMCLQLRSNQSDVIRSVVLMTAFEKAEGQLGGSQ